MNNPKSELKDGFAFRRVSSFRNKEDVLYFLKYPYSKVYELVSLKDHGYTEAEFEASGSGEYILYKVRIKI